MGEAECGGCGGIGSSYDPTLSDSVCSGGSGSVRCPRCGGTGQVTILQPSAYELRLTEAVRAGRNPLAGAEPLPDWML